MKTHKGKLTTEEAEKLNSYFIKHPQIKVMYEEALEIKRQHIINGDVDERTQSFPLSYCLPGGLLEIYLKLM